MAVTANGAKLEWHSYEYARIVRGKIVETGDLGAIMARKKALKLPGRIKFRALYTTDWIEVTNEDRS